MKITIKEREADDYGDGEVFKLLLETDNSSPLGFTAGNGEPEDNYLFRDLAFVYDIEDMLKAAYEAGKAGEMIEVEKIKLEKDED